MFPEGFIPAWTEWLYDAMREFACPTRYSDVSLVSTKLVTLFAGGQAVDRVGGGRRAAGEDPRLLRPQGQGRPDQPAPQDPHRRDRHAHGRHPQPTRQGSHRLIGLI